MWLCKILTFNIFAYICHVIIINSKFLLYIIVFAGFLNIVNMTFQIILQLKLCAVSLRGWNYFAFRDSGKLL